MKTAVVSLYGIYTPDRTDYAPYFDFLVTEIKAKKLDKVILCGGYTNPKYPKVSEASSARDYLLKKYPEFTKYVLEDKSINTNQNLEFARKNINNNDELFVYCDLIRKAKVAWIAIHFLLQEPQNAIYKAILQYYTNKKLTIYDDFEYKNAKVIGYDFATKSKEETIEQTFATLIDVMALYNKDLEDIALKQRKSDFGLS